MRTVLTGILALTMMTGAAAPAFATCLEANDIAEARGEANGTSIMFRMRGGAQWRNTVQGQCAGLAQSLISWTATLNGPNGQFGICDGHSTPVWVQSAHTSCKLGNFERVMARPAAPAQ